MRSLLQGSGPVTLHMLGRGCAVARRKENSHIASQSEQHTAGETKILRCTECQPVLPFPHDNIPTQLACAQRENLHVRMSPGQAGQQKKMVGEASFKLGPLLTTSLDNPQCSNLIPNILVTPYRQAMPY